MNLLDHLITEHDDHEESDMSVNNMNISNFGISDKKQKSSLRPHLQASAPVKTKATKK